MQICDLNQERREQDTGEHKKWGKRLALSLVF